MKYFVLMLSVLCFIAMTSTDGPEKYHKKAKEIAQKAFVELSSNLKKQMQEKGPIGAIEFCNVHAISLTQKLAESAGVQLQRVSLKNRNPINEAQGQAKETLEKWAQLDISELKPMSFDSKKAVEVYLPIVTRELCLKCHGENISVDLQREIKKRYPLDKAKGYQSGQLRGAWKIVFPKVN